MLDFVLLDALRVFSFRKYCAVSTFSSRLERSSSSYTYHMCRVNSSKIGTNCWEEDVEKRFQTYIALYFPNLLPFYGIIL